MSVMMCYDKKLEASRSDFYNDLYRTRDTDCVITSGTILEWDIPISAWGVPLMDDVLILFARL